MFCLHGPLCFTRRSTSNAKPDWFVLGHHASLWVHLPGFLADRKSPSSFPPFLRRSHRRRFAVRRFRHMVLACVRRTQRRLVHRASANRLTPSEILSASFSGKPSLKEGVDPASEGPAGRELHHFEDPNTGEMG